MCGRADRPVSALMRLAEPAFDHQPSFDRRHGMLLRATVQVHCVLRRRACQSPTKMFTLESILFIGAFEVGLEHCMRGPKHGG